jgi:hypothetical protein
MANFEDKLKNLLSNLGLETTIPKLWINEYFDKVIAEIDVIAETKINAIDSSETEIQKINDTRDKYIVDVNKLKEINFSYYETYKEELDKELNEIIESTKSSFIQYPKKTAIVDNQFQMKMLYYLRHLFFKTCFLVSSSQNELIGDLVLVDYHFETYQIEQIRGYISSIFKKGVFKNFYGYNTIYYSVSIVQQ